MIKIYFFLSIKLVEKISNPIIKVHYRNIENSPQSHFLWATYNFNEGQKSKRKKIIFFEIEKTLKQMCNVTIWKVDTRDNIESTIRMI